MTVVVMDAINTPYLYQAEGKRRLIAYLQKSLRRDEPTALFGLGRSGLKELHPFSTDTAVLIAALNKMKGEVGTAEMGEQSAAMVADAVNMAQSTDQTVQQITEFMNDQEAMINASEQQAATRTTLEAMSQLAHAYAAIPGRKTLIWASGGFPFMIDDPQAFGRMGTEMMGMYEKTWRELISAQVAIYTVDVTGLSGGTLTASGMADANRAVAGRKPGGSMGLNPALSIPYDKGMQRIASLRAAAESTGGLPCVNTNDLEKCFSRAVEDSRQYYVLGYYLPADDVKPGWRKLKVKVTAEGAHVRAREGFYVSGGADVSPEARQRQMIEALRSPVEFTGLRLNVREVPLSGDARPAAAGKQWHEFTVGVLGSRLTIDGQNGNGVDFHVISVAFDAKGNNVGHAEHRVSARLDEGRAFQVRHSAIGVRQALELAPGKYEVRFAVLDNLSGEIGTLKYPLEVK
jgi:VWFA-related protein